MYSVSADYLTAIANNARAHKIRGTINGVPFTGKDIISGTFAINNQICQATEISLGGVYIGELSFVLSPAFANAMNIRGSWRGVAITAEIGVELEDESFEYIPIPGGTYTVEEANWTNNGLAISAFDNMSKFDRAFYISQSSGTVFDFLTLACTSCGATLGMSAIDCAALPNGTEVLGLYPDDSIETYRDMISKLATVCCCFATIDRSGRLIFVQLPKSSDVTATVNAKARYSTSFSDYASFYDTISVVNMADETTSTYSNDNHGGLTMNLGSNPFLQYGTAETVTRIRQTIVDELEEFISTPFSVSMLPNPAFDLGDLLRFSGGIGNDSLGCIMSITYGADFAKVEGYGENPALADARSKTDKEISGLLGKTQENEVIIYTFVNAQTLTLGDEEEVDIIEIRFATVTPKIVQLFHEIKLDVEAVDNTAPIVCTVHYYLNGEELSYHPVTSWDNDGYHLLHLFYFLTTLEDGQRYDWKVALELSNGTGTIDRDEARASLFGQGLVAVDKWDGEVTVEDPAYSLILGGYMRFDYEEAAPTITLKGPDEVSVSDDYELKLRGRLALNYTETDVSIITRQNVYRRITENGDIRTTEIDDTRITEGG